MKVLVVGGTGIVGKMIAETLLKRRHKVTILVRDNEESLSNAMGLIDIGARVVRGDLTKPSSLENVAHDIDCIVATAATLDDSFAKGYEAIMASARRSNVFHFVYVSNWPRIEPLLPMFEGKAHIEQILSGNKHIPYTIVQAEPFLGYAVNSMIKAPLAAGYPIGIFAKDQQSAQNGRHYWVAEKDVAAYTAAVVGMNAAFDKTYHIGGEMPLTFMELVQRYGSLNGVAVSTMVLTEPPPGMPDFIYKIIAQLSEYDSPKPNAARFEFGIKVTHPDSILYQMD